MQVKQIMFSPSGLVKLQTKVRQSVNKTMADLVAWSLHYSALGVYPERGFYGDHSTKDPTGMHFVGNLLQKGSSFFEQNLYLVFIDPCRHSQTLGYVNCPSRISGELCTKGISF